MDAIQQSITDAIMITGFVFVMMLVIEYLIHMGGMMGPGMMSPGMMRRPQ